MPNRPTFNLLDESWLPVERMNGEAADVSLLEVFSEAAKIRRILDASPLVTISLYRLLFAIFHRAVPIKSHNQWADAWESLNSHEQVGDYLKKWRHRFDLFDPLEPFWQVPDLDTTVGTVAWTKMATEHNVNNSKVWFDHTVTALEPTPITPAYAARLLVATQVASVGAGKSGTGYNINAPIATALVVILEGRNLAETLLANFRIGESSADDSAIWEREPTRVNEVLTASEEKAPGRPFRGIVDRLTWQTRAIQIVPPAESSGVKEIHFGAGLRYAAIPDDRDPWVPYRSTKDGEWVPRRWQLDRALWRDLHTLVIHNEGVSTVPLIIRDVAVLENEDRAPTLWSLLVAGQAADKAKIEGWGLERWSVPHGLIINAASVVETLKQAVNLADHVAEKLRRLSFSLARDLLANGEKRRAGDISEAARQLPLANVASLHLERPYAHLLQRLINDEDISRAQALSAWRTELAAAIEAGAAATYTSIGRDSRSIRAWARFAPQIEALSRQQRKSTESS